MKTYKGGTYSSSILDLGIRWRWVFSFQTPAVLPPGKRPTVPQSRFGLCAVQLVCCCVSEWANTSHYSIVIDQSVWRHACGLHDLGTAVRFLGRQEIMYSTASRLTVGAHSASRPVGTEDYLPGVQWSGCEADYGKVQEPVKFYFLAPYVLMVLCALKAFHSFHICHFELRTYRAVGHM
jgi:hypothetical protein